MKKISGPLLLKGVFVKKNFFWNLKTYTYVHMYLGALMLSQKVTTLCSIKLFEYFCDSDKSEMETKKK
jgi:hypothetical protein